MALLKVERARARCCCWMAPRLDRSSHVPRPLLSKPPSNTPKAVRNIKRNPRRTQAFENFSRIHFRDMDRSLSEQGLLEGGPQAVSEAVTPSNLHALPPPPPPMPMAMMQLHPQNLVPPSGQFTGPQYDPLAMAALSLNTSNTSIQCPPSGPTGRNPPPQSCDLLRSLFLQLVCSLRVSASAAASTECFLFFL